MLPGGFIGVDVFFVISGCLITGLLARELKAEGRIDYGRFVARRACRLLPASLVMIAAVSLLGLALYPALERGEVFDAARSAAVYLANFWFAAIAFDYLGGDAATNTLVHMWSLGVEEHFYLGWPILLAAAVCLPRVRPLSWKSDASVELEHLRRRYHKCEAWRAEAMRRIRSLAPDVVVVASIGRYKLAAADLQEAMRRTIHEFQASARAVVLVRDTPWPGFNVPVCLARAQHRGADPDAACRLDARKAIAPGLGTFEVERKVAEETGATMVDLTDHLCGPLHCDVRTGEVVRYRDHSHLTATFARSLAPAIAPVLQAAVSG